MVSSDELNAAQQQINAARDQTHTNIAAAKSWADLAKDSADLSGAGSASAAAADANRAEIAKGEAFGARDEASGFAGSASSDADRAASERGLAEAARDRAEAVPDVQDGLLASIVSDEGSDSRAALNATYPQTALTAVRVPAEVTFTAIQNALTDAKTSGEKVVVGGTITTPYQLTIECDCDLSQLTVNYTGTGVAVQAGVDDAVTFRKRMRLPRVIHPGKTDPGWAQVAGTVGIRLVNLNACPYIEVPHVQNFERGLVESGINSMGNAYNQIHLGHLDNNKINHDYEATANGWCNENRHFGGRMSYNSIEGMDAPGTRQVRIPTAENPINNHTYFGTSIESDIPEWTLEALGGQAFQFVGCRWERTDRTGGGIGAKVLWGASAVRHMILGGYAAHLIRVTRVTGEQHNEIIAPRRHEFLGSGSDRAPVQFNNSFSKTSPAWEVLDTLATLDPAAWVWRATSTQLQGRRSTEAHPRVILDAQNGQVLIGNGAVAPTAGFKVYGASGITPSGALWFPAGEGPILVSAGGTQRRLVLNDDGTLTTGPI